MPATATARVRQLSRGGRRKNDVVDAAAAASVAALHGAAVAVTPEGLDTVLAMLDERRTNLTTQRTRTVNQLHALLRELLPDGAKTDLTAEQAAALLSRLRPAAATLEETPTDATHWSRTSMAARSGLSKSTIGRIWRKFGLKPHLVDTFELSTDPLFVEKVVDVVGLYHNPPEKAVVLCVDEKSQIQALDRSQPVLPMMPGVPRRQSHSYIRHGITSLFATFNIADGTVISELHRQHRASEFRKFLTTIDKRAPTELDVHVVCDN